MGSNNNLHSTLSVAAVEFGDTSLKNGSWRSIFEIFSRIDHDQINEKRIKSKNHQFYDFEFWTITVKNQNQSSFSQSSQSFEKVCAPYTWILLIRNLYSVYCCAYLSTPFIFNDTKHHHIIISHQKTMKNAFPSFSSFVIMNLPSHCDWFTLSFLLKY